MTRVHPQFLMNGFKKAVEKQDFGEFNKELTNGMNYWTNLFNTEVGALDPDEAPLIIAALEELASTYKKTVPGAGNIADTFRKLIYQHVFEERTFEEMSRLNGLSEERCKGIYYYAIRKIRKVMGGEN